MHAVHIRRWHARYRLPERDARQRRRLDSILASSLGEVIESALAPIPLAPREELCIRHLVVPVRVNLAGSDLAVARAWADAVAAAIQTARHTPSSRRTTPGPETPDGHRLEVMRFPSREHALLDLAVQVSEGRPDRLWAWRQLDL